MRIKGITRLFAIVMVFLSGVAFYSLDAFAKNFGITYSGGSKFVAGKNINVSSTFLNGHKDLLARDNIVNKNFKPTSGYRKWYSGWVISGSSDRRCFEVNFFRLTATGVSGGENVSFTITEGQYEIDVVFKEIAVEGWDKSMISSVAIAKARSFNIDVGRTVYTDSKCTNVKTIDGDPVGGWGGNGSQRVFVRVQLKVRKKGESAVSVIDDMYFKLADIDGGQSYKIMNENGTYLKPANMFSNNLTILNSLDNRYVSSGYYVYNADEGAVDSGSNIYVKQNNSVQQKGLDIVFGFTGMAGSDISYVVPKEPENPFKGSIEVGDKKVGPTNVTTIGDTYFINGCSPVTGCQVTFKHAINREFGNEETSYSISRTSNYDERGVGDRSNEPSGNTSGGKMSYSDGPLTLYPGQQVCETLTFKPGKNSSNATLKICAVALGVTNDPDNPNSPNNAVKEAFISMQVKNTTGEEKYRTYQKEVYAKPKDVLDYLATYNPLPQYAYYIDEVAAKLDPWRNAFAVYSTRVVDGISRSGFFSRNYNGYPNGDMTRRQETNPWTVETADVGGILTEIAETNHNDDVKHTPNKLTFTNVNGKINVSIDISKKSDSARALVPYNFNLDFNYEDEPEEPEEKIIDAGEDTPVVYKIDVKPKPNQETSPDEPYATIVRDAKVKIVVYVPTDDNTDGGRDNYPSDNICGYFGRANGDGYCKYPYEANKNMNTDGVMSGVKETIRATINEDRPAGTRICVAAAVYPSSSGADTNLDKKGNNMWRISKSTCYAVAKKPTFQVWGGNFYSIGNVYTLTSNKLLGQGNDKQRIIFSSWVERDITTIGKTKNLASGAATGLANNLAGGGSKESSPSFCDFRTPLSLANNGGNILPICPTNRQETGLSGISADTVDIEKLISDLPVNLGGKISTDSLTISEQVSIANGQTYVARTNGNITINADIIYAQTNNISLSNLDTIPKAFIYANNITIGCNVKRIDAILIANRVVDTCNVPGDDKANARERSNQLVVNGAIIANKLNLGRTFGAYIGAYTKIPAEVVNYDTSVILWVKNKQQASNYNNMTAVYRHELAPRR